MIHSNKNSTTPAQKLDLENPMHLSQHYQNFWHLDIYVQLLNEEVTVEILHKVRYIRSSLGYLRKPPTVGSAFLAEKHIWFYLYENRPSFTFQYFFLNQFQTSLF